MVMVSNNSGRVARLLAKSHPGRVGHLYSPGGQRGPFQEFPYALDNGAFTTWRTGKPFDWAAWGKLVWWGWTRRVKPLWLAIPDVVADFEATLDRWPIAKARLGVVKLPCAFVAQDGCRPEDVPGDADMTFIGGTTAWKEASVAGFCEAGQRVHVGRVNGYRMLRLCHEAGVESVDGTGWFRGDKVQTQGLIRYLEETCDDSDTASTT